MLRNDEKSGSQQEREIRDLVKRADKNIDRTGSMRRETLKQLINLTHSHHSPLQCFAAGHIRLFFKDFPDLEEEAINAVYDLCEDQVSSVRIEGYTAIVQVSREQKKWVKRNADVLVQLLQSDEPDEVIFVKRALLEHLDMDPPVTIGVLCDQIIQPDEPMDEEEQFMRDKSRSLVISFLTGEARRAIVDRHASRPGGEAEEVLISQLLMAIPKLSNAETGSIVNDLLLALPSYSATSQRGHELLKILLDKADISLREEARSAMPSLKTSRPLLDSAFSVAVRRQAAPPADLLRFHCQLFERADLSKWPQSDRVYLIERTVETLAACEDEHTRHSSSSKAQISALREQFVTISPTVLELLARFKLQYPKLWRTCEITLQACLREKTDRGWTMPSAFATSLNDIRKFAESLANGENKDIINNVQKLIRSLSTPSVKSNPSIRTSVPPMTKNGTPTQLRNMDARPKSRSPQTPTDSSNFGRTNALSRPQVGQRDNNSGTGLAIRGAQHASSAGSSTGSLKRDIDMDDSLRSLKKAKKSSGPGDNVPSLLSRLDSTNGSAAQHIVPALPTRRTDNKQPAATPSIQHPVDLDAPSGGWSIRGAASRSEQSSPKPVSRTTSSSLLERMKDVDISPASVDKGSWKRRKRGGAQ